MSQDEPDEQAVAGTAPTPAVRLRELTDDDLPILFEQQLDPDANYMAAFTAKDPADRAAFMAHWARIRADDGVTIRTIEYGGRVAGSILCHDWFGEPEVSYWLGREFWGRGVATEALREFLQILPQRPILGRAAKDNVGSIRVLEKCGFRQTGETTGFAAARGREIPELIFSFDGP